MEVQTVTVAVLGGGMTGVVLAATLARDARFRVSLFERGSCLGGLHKSPVINDYAYDIGAFFFEPDHPVFATFPGLIEQFVPFDVKVCSIFEGGFQDLYPLTVKGYVRSRGLGGLARAVASLTLSKLRYRRRDTVAAFCRYYIGGELYETSGLRRYIERLYGLRDTEIDLMFAQQRMATLANWASLRTIARHASTYPARLWRSGYAKPRALARPREGFQAVYSHIEQSLSNAGVSVHKSAHISKIDRTSQGFSVTGDGVQTQFDRVVSTAPVPVTGRLIGVEMLHRFETMDLLTLFYQFEGDPGFNAVTLSNFSQGGRWKRIIDFAGFYGTKNGRHYLSVEITVAAGALLDVKDEVRQFEEHARSLGLFHVGRLILEGHHVTANAYPVFRRDSVDLIERDKQLVSDWGVVLAGRQGEFEYISSEQAAMSAIALAHRMTAELGLPDNAMTPG
ncbi:NAD(P)-binding protein [Mesorhizobium sp. M0028]|uniref:FAD-dependent oxidoreductase n=1 Tax=Mesorhizobium sp. M0028 TaxID=2956849 RepID=UPI00333D7FB5